MGFSGAVAAVMGRLARARRGSAIHEVGTVYDARLVLTGGGPGPFAAAGEHEVVVRLSRGIGLPAPFADVFGLGLRLAGPDGQKDLLLDSCRTGRVGRHVVTLRTDLASGPLGSLVALRHGAEAFHVGAFPRRTTPLRDTATGVGLEIVLAVATPSGPWRPVGTLRCLEVAADQSVRMSPVNTALDVTLSPWWDQFRGRSYRSSRAAVSTTR